MSEDWKSRSTVVSPGSQDVGWKSRSVVFNPNDHNSPIEEQDQATLEGFGQGVSAGHLAQLQAGEETQRNKGLQDLVQKAGIQNVQGGPEAMNAISSGKGLIDASNIPPEVADAALAAQGFKVDQADPTSYVQNRDQNIKRQGLLEQNNPGLYTASQVGGALASIPLISEALAPVLGAPAATLGGKMGQAGMAGLLEAGAQNPGDVPGIVNPIQAEERLKNAATGAEVGAGAGALGSAIGTGIKKAGLTSNQYAIKSSGAMLKDVRTIYKKGQMQSVADEMFNSKLIGPDMGFAEIADKSAEIKNQVGQRIGAIYDQVQGSNNISVDLKKLRNSLVTAVTDKAPTAVGVKEYANEMTGTIKQIFKDPAKLSDIRHVNDIIGEIDARINYSKVNKEQDSIAKGYYALREALRNSLNDVVEKVGQASSDPGLGSELKALNKRYGNLSTINKISEDRAARDISNRLFGVSETAGALGLGGYQTGKSLSEGDIPGAIRGVGLGLAGAAGARAARKYGTPMTAQAARSVSNMQGINPITSGLAAGKGVGLLKGNQ